MDRLPSVFVSHGSPMHALEPGAAGDVWRALGRRLGKPRAIVLSSAHWETNVPMLTGSGKPETIHDFYNFPEPLYRIRYDAPGAPQVAQRAQALLKAAGFRAAIDGTRGLDHGAWSPLLYMYPDADVPVVQVSVQPHLGPAHHIALGKALASMRDENFLVIGSGSLTHNLHEFYSSGLPGDAPALPWVADFTDWVHDKIEAGANDDLVNYRKLAPHAVDNHPTDEHLMPLFIAIGAGEAKGRRIHASTRSGVISMNTYAFG